MWEVAVTAGAALIGGAVGSLGTPWAQWSVEKRREVRKHQRDLIASWRDGVAEWEQEGGSWEVFTASWYGSLSPYLSADVKGAVQGRVMMVGSERRLGLAQALEETINAKEREWGLSS